MKINKPKIIQAQINSITSFLKFLLGVIKINGIRLVLKLNLFSS
jgi:hypothetical protein